MFELRVFLHGQLSRVRRDGILCCRGVPEVDFPVFFWALLGFYWVLLGVDEICRTNIQPDLEVGR